MKRVLCILVTALALAAVAGAAPADTLDVYFIDVEGGQATLVVTPAGESLLIDAGFPGTGTFTSRPRETLAPRDAGRIAAVARLAGLTRLDYLLVTHFHADHFGGVMELAQRLPIGTFIDHGDVPTEAEQNVPGTLALYQDYLATRATGRHLEPAAGDRLPLRGLEATVVSTRGGVIGQPLTGAGRQTPACGETPRAAEEIYENPRSTGVLIQFGAFRFLDVGDLSGPPLFDLVCPRNLIGPVDVYLVAHHGNADAADPAIFAALAPRVAVIDNGRTKGAAPEILATLHRASGLEDVWQLHRSALAGAENFPENRLANLDETTAYWIRVTASSDGSLRVTNERTGEVVRYAAR